MIMIIIYFAAPGVKTIKKQYIQRVCQLTGAKFINEHIDINTTKTFFIWKEIRLLEFN
jgi:hypothetical protein